MKIRTLLIAVLLSGFTFAAQAFTLTTSGTVNYGYDGQGLFGAAGSNLTGQSYSATLNFDPTNFAYQYNDGYTNYAYDYSSSNVFGTYWVSLNGITTSGTISNNFAQAYVANYTDYYYYYSNFSQVYGQLDGTNTATGNYSYLYQYLYSYNTNHLGLTGTDYNQLASYTTQQADEYGYGGFYDYNYTTGQYTQFDFTPSSYVLNGATPAFSSQVPEPTPLALFGIGLLGAGYIRHRKKS